MKVEYIFIKSENDYAIRQEKNSLENEISDVVSDEDYPNTN